MYLTSYNVSGARCSVQGNRGDPNHQVLVMGQPPNVVLHCALSKLEPCGKDSGHHLGDGAEDSPQQHKGGDGGMADDLIRGSQVTEVSHLYA